MAGIALCDGAQLADREERFTEYDKRLELD